MHGAKLTKTPNTRFTKLQMQKFTQFFPIYLDRIRPKILKKLASFKWIIFWKIPNFWGLWLMYQDIRKANNFEKNF